MLRAANCFETPAHVSTSTLLHDVTLRSRKKLDKAFWAHGGQDVQLPSVWILVQGARSVTRPNLLYGEEPHAPLRFLYPPTASYWRSQASQKSCAWAVDIGSARRPDRVRSCPLSTKSPLLQQVTSTGAQSSMKMRGSGSDTDHDISQIQSNTWTAQENSEPQTDGNGFSTIFRSKGGSSDDEGPGKSQRNPRGFSADSDGPASVQRRFPEQENDTEQATTTSLVEPDSTLSSISRQLKMVLSSGQNKEPNLVWNLYSQAVYPVEFRTQVLSYLAKASEPSTLTHGMQLYFGIPLEERVAMHYRDAAIIAARLRNGFEETICREALSRGLGKPCGSFLLCHFVLRRQWTRAAGLWQLACNMEKTNTAQAEGFSWRHDLSQRADLPKYWLHLAHSMQSTSAEGKQTKLYEMLTRFARSLSWSIFRSKKIMGSITGEGILNISNTLASLRMLHPNQNQLLVGISTLKNMPGSRLRNKLSLLLYNKFRLNFPDIAPPRATLGCLIEIQTDPDNATPKALRSTLSDFSRFYGIPDQRAYQRAMTAYARMGNAEDAKALLLESVANYGKPPNVLYVNPLIYAHAICGDLEGAYQAFDGITQFDLQPDVFSWNMLLFAHSRLRDLAGAFKLFRVMIEKGVEPDAHSFGTLMGLCGAVGDISAIHQLVNQARRRGILGNSALVQTLIEAYCTDDDPISAEKLLEATRNMPVKGPMTRSWNILLRYFAFKVDIEGVLRIQDRMLALNITPDAMTYAVLMQSLVILGRTDSALQVLRSLHFNRQTDATFLHFVILAHGYLREGQRDMLEVVYNEAVRRFSRSSFSLELSRLESLVKRDLSRSRSNESTRKVSLPRAEQYLFSLLRKIQRKDYATKSPMPGGNARSVGVPWAFPLGYFRFIVNVYSQHRQFEKVEQLLTYYQEWVKQNSNDITGRIDSLPIDLLIEQMRMLIVQRKFNKVDERWDAILHQGIKLARSTNLELTEPGSGSRLLHPSSTPPPQPDGSAVIKASMRNINLDDPLGTSFKILPSQSFILGRALDTYMGALASQGLFSRLYKVIDHIRSLGFRLTSKNCNTFVQALCRSPRMEDQTNAFQVFDETLAENLGAFSVRRADAKRNQRFARLHPSYYLPDYRTLMFLSRVLKASRERSLIDGSAALKRLAQVAQKTLGYLSRVAQTTDINKFSKHRVERASRILNPTRLIQHGIATKNKPRKYPRLGYIRKPETVFPGPLRRGRYRTILGGSSVEAQASSHDIASILSSDSSQKTDRADLDRMSEIFEQYAAALGGLRLRTESHKYQTRPLSRIKIRQRRTALRGIRKMVQDRAYEEYLTRRLGEPSSGRAVLSSRVGDSLPRN